MSIIHIADNSKKIVRYKNAITRRYHNKEVSIIKTDIGYLFKSKMINKESANEVSCRHICIKNVISINEIQISKETLEAFMLNAMDILKRNL